MKNVRDVLHDADPLRHEPDRLAAERERLRHAAIGAAAHVPRSASGPARRTVALAAPIVLLVGAVMTLGGGLWPRGTTTVQAAILFEVRLAEEHPGDGLREARVGESDRLVYLHPEIVVSNSDIASSGVVEAQDGAGFGVVVEFTAEGARRMAQATADHLGRPVAILVDGDVVASPILRSPINTSAVISGDYTAAEAERIVTGIRLW